MFLQDLEEMDDSLREVLGHKFDDFVQECFFDGSVCSEKFENLPLNKHINIETLSKNMFKNTT